MLDENKIETSGQELAKLTNQAFTYSERIQAGNRWLDLNEFINNNNYNTSDNGGAITSQSSWDAGIASGTSAGSKNTNRVFDGTAGRAATDLTSYIHGTLTNPVSPWAGLVFSGEHTYLNQDKESTLALQKAERSILTNIQNSNFSDTMIKVYMSYVVLGNSALFHQVKADGSYVFTALNVGQIAWAEGEDSRVDTVFRKIKMSAKQVKERWGERAPEYVKNMSDEFTQVELVHIVMPRKGVRGDEGELTSELRRPIASYYIDLQSSTILEEGGFYEMPIFATRYHTMPGEIYGRGPGDLAIDDTKTLNKMRKLNLDAVTLDVKRPLFVNQKDILGGQFKIKPGQITVMKNINGFRPWEIGNGGQQVEITVERLVENIKQSFFLDKLLLPSRTETGEMTAFEVSKRLEQTQMVLGPVLSRLNNELLAPLILRMFRDKVRRNEVDISPEMESIDAWDISVVFNNQLMQAQRLQDVSNINQWVQIIGGMSQLDPEVIDNIDFDEAARISGEVLQVPAEVIKSREDMQKEREERAEQQRQQAALQNIPPLADAMNKVGA